MRFNYSKAEALELWNSSLISNDDVIRSFEDEICCCLSIEGTTLPYELKQEIDRWLSILRGQHYVFSDAAHFLRQTTKHCDAWSRKHPVLLDTIYSVIEQMETFEQLDGSPSKSVQGLVPFSSPAFGPSLNELDLSNRHLLAALSELDQSNPEAARFAVLRLFAGRTLPEIADRTGHSLQETYETWRDVQTRLHQHGVKTEAGIWLPVASDDILRVIAEDPRLLQQVSWREFERIIADLLARLGFQIELQQGTKDGGIDILALRGGPMGDHRYLIQAKRWANKVGVEPVRQLLFLQGHYRATKGCLATTGTFTRGALQLASEYRWQLDLKDLEGIQKWVAEAVRGIA
jgi:hypothetical protein